MVAGRIPISRLNCLIVLLCLLAGCAGLGKTKPNEPFKGPYPSEVNELSVKNPLLVKELGKLPEISDGISEKEANALNIIAKLYEENPKAFDSAFKQMYQIGLPEVREYCSPLQAFFWMIEDGKLEAAKDILKDYSLIKLLSAAWDFQVKSLPFSIEQISLIIANTIDKGVRTLYLHNKNDKEYLQYLITRNYKYRAKIFKRQARKIIEKVKSENKYKDIRWNDFNTVVERLNAPELIDYYERRRFRYGDPRHQVSVYYVFKHNEGVCDSITNFTVYCLRKAGYRAEAIRIPGVHYPYHVICLFEMNGKKYVMDNGRPSPRGIFPYEELKFIKEG